MQRDQVIDCGDPAVGGQDLILEALWSRVREDHQRAIPAIAKNPGLTQVIESAVRRVRVVTVQRRVQSSLRLQSLASCVIDGLSTRGLPGAESEVTIRGAGRDKRWDVGWALHGKHRLAVSLKSILHNLAGTVPNRLDDLMGEAANVQLLSPEIVLDMRWCSTSARSRRVPANSRGAKFWPPGWSVSADGARRTGPSEPSRRPR